MNFVTSIKYQSLGPTNQDLLPFVTYLSLNTVSRFPGSYMATNGSPTHKNEISDVWALLYNSELENHSIEFLVDDVAWVTTNFITHVLR